MSLGDIGSFIRAHGYLYLTEQEVRVSAKSLARALGAMHKEGFLHNDVQPSSILLHRHRKGKGFSVKLGALSHARPIGAPLLVQDPNDSQIEGLNGLYKAPEVILGNGEGTSEASDVWSLGVTLFALTTGEFPFKTVSEVLNHDSVIFDTQKFNIKLSQSFKHLLAGMLQADSATRLTLPQILEHEWMNQSY